MIEKAKPEHARGIQELMKLMWCKTYPSKKHGISLDMIKKHTMNWDDKNTIDRVAASIKESPNFVQHLVATENGKVVGNLVVVHSEIKALYVHTDIQNKGIATAMLNKVNASKLYVATYNNKAIVFYKNYGYTITEKTYKKFDFGTIPVYKMSIVK